MAIAVEYALMAGHAYRTTRHASNWRPAPLGWTPFFPVPDDSTALTFTMSDGFEAISFINGNDIVISYAGTDGNDFWGDKLADGALAAGVGSSQLLQAAEYYLQVKAANPEANITFTGHSLGGGLAALMGALFDETAFTFDQAPFQNSANLLVATDLLLKLKLAFPANSYPEITDWLAPLESFVQDGLAAREANVTNINVQGEFLSTGLWTLFGRIGSATVISNNAPGIDGYDLHSQSLLTAFLQSIQTAAPNQTLNDATFQLPDLLGMSFDESLLANPTSKANNRHVNFLEHLVRHEAGVQGEFAADGMVTRFTADLWKIAQDGGLTLTNSDISKTLLAFAMQMYYENADATDADKQLFSNIGGGIHFDRSDVAATLTAAKGYTQQFMNYLAGLPSAERIAIQGNLPNLLDWYIQAGGQAMVATAGERRAFMLGGVGDDWHTGCSMADILVGNEGADILIGGSGDDGLLGGAGDDILDGGAGRDTYIVDGHDVIEDSDGLGSIRDKTGRYIGGHIQSHSDGTYTVVSDTAIDVSLNQENNDLTLTLSGETSIVIKNYHNGDLGLHLFQDATPSQVFDTTIGGDGDDDISVQAGNDWVEGRNGMDRLFGHLGNDTLEGGADSDILAGGDGDDQLYGDISVDIATAIALGAGIGSGLRGDFLSGERGRDILVGSAGNDVLMGGADEDVLIGGAGDDYILGDASAVAENRSWAVRAGTSSYVMDYVIGPLDSENDAADVVYAGAGADHIWAGGGDDVLYGETGDDYLEAEAGNDYLDGGEGDDCFWGDDAQDTSGSSSGNDVLIGGAGDDELKGMGGDDTLLGGTGDDLLIGDWDELPETMNGNDYLDGGDGNDELQGGGGIDILIGGTGNDTLFGEAGDDALYGDDDNDQIQGGDGNDALMGGSGDDSLTGQAGDDALYGEDGNDQLQGGDGSDVLSGGIGNDTLFGENGGDILIGDDGDDGLEGGNDNDTLMGGVGADMLLGDSGDDSLYGENENDHLQGGDGNDALMGGTGDDALFGDAGDDVLQGEDGNDHMWGGDGNDVLSGGVDNDILYGEGVDVTLEGGAGYDTRFGVVGHNTYVVVTDGWHDIIRDATRGDTLHFGAGIASDLTVSVALDDNNHSYLILTGSGGSVAIAGALMDGLNTVTFADTGPETVRQVITQGNGGDQMVVGAGGTLQFSVSDGQSVAAGFGADTISAWGDNDTLTAGLYATQIHAGGDNTLVNGGTGNDTLVASGSNDTLIGGLGDDTYIVHDSSTVIQVEPDSGADLVLASVNYTLPDYVQALTLTGAANLVAHSNAIGGVLTGNAGNSTLIGGAGDDTLISGSDIDTIMAGNGIDLIVVNNEADVVLVDPYSHGADIVFSSVSYVLPDYVQSLTLTGSDNLTATSNAAGGVLTGNAGSHILIGGAGSDILIAGIGLATLIGGGGQDTFVINNINDVIELSPNSTGNAGESSVSYTMQEGVSALRFNGNDNLVGVGNSDSYNEMTANAGNTTLIAGSGEDYLFGGTGSDRLVAGSGMSYLYGGAGLGLDTLVAGSGTAYLEGEKGDTYEFNGGFGDVNVHQKSGTGTIVLGVGITPADLILSVAIGGDGKPALQIQSGGTITVDDGFDGRVTSYRFANGAALSLDQLLDQAHIQASSVAGASGNLVLNDAHGVSLVGGPGQDTLYGFGDNDTLTAGDGNQVIYGFGMNDVLVGGVGRDTLYGFGDNATLLGGSGDEELRGLGMNTVEAGGSGNDTLRGGRGTSTLIAGIGTRATTLNGGEGTDWYVLAGGGVTIIKPSTTVGDEVVSLPSSMGMADFISYASGDNLILQSNDGGTIAIIQGFYNSLGYKTWYLASDLPGDNNAPILLQEWAATQPMPGEQAYETQIATLLSSASRALEAHLNDVGAKGGTLGTLTATRFSAEPVSSYSFSGVTQQTLHAGGGSLLFIPSSEAGEDEYLTQVTTETITSPVYTLQTAGGNSYYISADSLPTGGTSMPPGAIVTPVYSESLRDPITNDPLLEGYNVHMPGTTRQVQTGTTTTLVTHSSHTLSSTRGFTQYTIKGDASGNTIVAPGPFVGTVELGDGDNYVYLGTTSFDRGDWVGGNRPNTSLPLLGGTGAQQVETGVYISAGSGNDTLFGTDGYDTFAAGLGIDLIDGGRGEDTYYAPLQGYATTVIRDSGNPWPYLLDLLVGGEVMSGTGYPLPEMTGVLFNSLGPGAFPLDKLILPAGVTPGDLEYRVFQDPNNPYGEVLQLNYEHSSILINFWASPYIPADERGITDYTDGKGLSDIYGFNPHVVSSPEITTPAHLGVDIIQFANGTTLKVADFFSANPALLNYNPTVSALTPTVLTGQPLAATEIFSASDAPDFAITWYRISNTGIGGGYFTLGEQPLPVCQSFTINAGQLGQLAYIGGDVDSTDTIQISAFDGIVWSPVTSMTVTPIENANEGSDTVQSNVTYTLGANIKNLLLTGTADINGTGNTLNNALTGNSGNHDLDGGAGADTLSGGRGDDTYVIDNTGDVVVENASEGNDTVQSNVTYTLGANVENLNLTGSADINGTGNALNNALTGNSGNNVLDGGAGADTLSGGLGNDVYYIDNTGDVVVENANEGIDTVYSNINSYVLGANIENLTLTGTGAISGNGN